MPAGLVEDDNRMGTGSNGLRDFLQVQVPAPLAFNG